MCLINGVHAVPVEICHSQSSSHFLLLHSLTHHTDSLSSFNPKTLLQSQAPPLLLLPFPIPVITISSILGLGISSTFHSTIFPSHTLTFPRSILC
ncbi:hypothetical protein VNO80_18861 [Phaseolus coccineus]|uniref:Uncharacterized protein n=1 Tax=Phaseolus coccineus TaxID=3886 RepID=A0AAN9MF11_PHACN